MVLRRSRPGAGRSVPDANPCTSSTFGRLTRRFETVCRPAQGNSRWRWTRTPNFPERHGTRTNLEAPGDRRPVENAGGNDGGSPRR